MAFMVDPRVERWIRPAPWDPEEEVAHLRGLPPDRLLQMQRDLSELCMSMSRHEAPREPMSEAALAWWLELVRRGRLGDGRQRS